MGFLIFSIPLLILLFVMVISHISFTTLSLVLGIISLATGNGRRAGIAGLVITGVANLVTVGVIVLLIVAANMQAS